MLQDCAFEILPLEMAAYPTDLNSLETDEVSYSYCFIIMHKMLIMISIITFYCSLFTG